jgi:hypothetical protein
VEPIPAAFEFSRTLRANRAVVTSTFIWLPTFIVVLGHVGGRVPGSLLGRDLEWLVLAGLFGCWGLTIYNVLHDNQHLRRQNFGYPLLISLLGALIVANGGIGLVAQRFEALALLSACLITASVLAYSLADYLFPQAFNVPRALALANIVLLVLASAGLIATFFLGFSGIALALYTVLFLTGALVLLQIMQWLLRTHRLVLIVMPTILANAVLTWLYLLDGWSLLAA